MRKKLDADTLETFSMPRDKSILIRIPSALSKKLDDEMAKEKKKGGIVQCKSDLIVLKLLQRLS